MLYNIDLLGFDKFLLFGDFMSDEIKEAAKKTKDQAKSTMEKTGSSMKENAEKLKKKASEEM